MADFMLDKTNTVRKIKKKGKKLSHDAAFNPIVETMARLGYASRGLIYFVMGLLAILLAFNNGGKSADQQGAVVAIGGQPEGRALLYVVFIGLVCYSLWGVIRALLNPLHKEHDKKGNAERAGYLFSGIAYALLALSTYALIMGGAKPASNGQQEIQTQHYVAKILAFPLGQILVGIIGVIVIIVGFYQVYQAIMPHFEGQLHLVSLNTSQAKWVKTLGRVGTISRGVIIAFVGFFLIIAAYTANSNQAKGFDSTLMSLMQLPYGRLFMGIISLGLISLGIYSVFVALFFRLRKF